MLCVLPERAAMIYVHELRMDMFSRGELLAIAHLHVFPRLEL